MHEKQNHTFRFINPLKGITYHHHTYAIVFAYIAHAWYAYNCKWRWRHDIISKHNISYKTDIKQLLLMFAAQVSCKEKVYYLGAGVSCKLYPPIYYNTAAKFLYANFHINKLLSHLHSYFYKNLYEYNIYLIYIQ